MPRWSALLRGLPMEEPLLDLRQAPPTLELQCILLIAIQHPHMRLCPQAYLSRNTPTDSTMTSSEK